MSEYYKIYKDKQGVVTMNKYVFPVISGLDILHSLDAPRGMVHVFSLKCETV